MLRTMTILEKVFNTNKVFKKEPEEESADAALAALLSGTPDRVIRQTMNGAIPRCPPFSPRVRLPGKGHFKLGSAPHCK